MSKKIIIYDDDEIMYYTGKVQNILPEYIEIDATTSSDSYKKTSPYLSNVNLVVSINQYDENETIKLDETMMKRIAKFNKEAEVKKIENKIERRQKQLEGLEKTIEDREKRWKKIQEFVAGIYDLDLADDEDDYDYDYD